MPRCDHRFRRYYGHEFQTKFHWHVEDLGMSPPYIKPRTPRLNGKVERSHLTDEQELYQLLEYTDDVDLNEKLAEWESFYNLSRPHGAFAGKTPYEVLKEKMRPPAGGAGEAAPVVQNGGASLIPSDGCRA
jgi:transposase InsO family protein